MKCGWFGEPQDFDLRCEDGKSWRDVEWLAGRAPTVDMAGCYDNSPQYERDCERRWREAVQAAILRLGAFTGQRS